VPHRIGIAFEEKRSGIRVNAGDFFVLGIELKNQSGFQF
jgi:hypothetical protein